MSALNRQALRDDATLPRLPRAGAMTWSRTAAAKSAIGDKDDEHDCHEVHGLSGARTAAETPRLCGVPGCALRFSHAVPQPSARLAIPLVCPGSGWMDGPRAPRRSDRRRGRPGVAGGRVVHATRPRADVEALGAQRSAAG